MKSVLQIVDSVEYIRTNCFQHQLLDALNRCSDLTTISLNELGSINPKSFDSVVSCLKQRTIHANLDKLARLLDGTKITVYDQDCWHSYMDDSPYKGIYDQLVDKIDVKTIAVTTRWWADFMNNHGINASFVKMWMLPNLCNKRKKYIDRKIETGFIGTVHTHRKILFSKLATIGIQVDTRNGFSYKDYLKNLGDIKIFVHSEDYPIQINSLEYSLNVGLVKDIETSSQNCFSIRSSSVEKQSYFDENIKTVYFYDNIDEIPSIIEFIEKMDVVYRQTLLDDTNDYIRSNDEWLKTAEKLIE